MGFGVWGMELGIWGLGFGVQRVGFGVWSLGFMHQYMAGQDLRLRKLGKLAAQPVPGAISR